MEKNKQPVRVSTVLIYVFFCFMMVLYLAPIAWIAMTSVKDRASISAASQKAIPPSV